MSIGEAVVRGILPTPKYVTTVYQYQKTLAKYQARVDNLRAPGIQDVNQKYLDALRRALEQADGLDKVFAHHITNKSGKYIVFCANSRIGEEFKSEAAKTLNEYSWVLSYGRTKKTHLVRWTMQILGVNTTMRILDIYMRLRSSNRGGVKCSSFTITLQPFANSYLPACGGCC